MATRYQEISMPVFQELLTGPNLTTRQLKRLGDVVDYGETGKGHDMYPRLCRKLNAVIKLTKANFIFKEIADWSESGNTDHQPDLAMYPTHSQAVDAYTLTDRTIDKLKLSEASEEYIARCAYAWMTTAVEVKRRDSDSGFGFDLGDPILREDKEAFELRSRFAAYAAEIMLRQHRTHVYMFYISGWRARAFRWDRNGAVVSHPIDLRTNCKQLLNLIYRLALADPETQGFDTTVCLANQVEIEKLRVFTPNNTYLEEYKNMMLDNLKEHPVFKVECDEVLLQSDHRRTRSSLRKSFLIGRHVAGGYEPTGRGTKGWVAYCLDDNAMMFMKEQWRANSDGAHPEIQTYLRLREHGVQCVATLIAGGDVNGPRGLHRTVSQRFFDKQGVKIPERIQTRLVLKEVGRPLETYRDSVELIVVTTHALIGHQQAWEKADILHRDVSVANILIDTADGKLRGFLSDWDLCKYKTELSMSNGTSQPVRVSGTWVFGSALSLMYPRKPKELADDLESFIYVPTYCAFRYHKHNFSSENADTLKNTTQTEQRDDNHENTNLAQERHHFFYKDKRHSNGLYTGGRMKHLIIGIGTPPLELQQGNYPLSKLHPLSRLLEESFKLLRNHYRAVNLDDLERYKPDPMSSKLPTPQPVIQRSGSPPEVIDPLAGLGIPRPDTPSTMASSSPSSSPSESSGTHVRVLDDHKNLLDVFLSVFRGNKGQALDMSAFRNDKLYDQFDNNTVILEGEIHNPSSNSAKESNATRSRKRSSDDSRIDSNPREVRRVE